MKNLICLMLLLIGNVGWGQITGNGNVTTARVPAEGLEELWVNLNMDVDVVTGGNESYIEVTTDENIIPYINLDTKNGKLEIDQKKWIESSGTFKMVIYAPGLKEVYNDSWVNMNITLNGQERFSIISTISEIKVAGKVGLIVAETDDSDIVLTDLQFEAIKANVIGDGHIIVSDKNRIFSEDVVTLEEVNRKKDLPEFADAKFIDLRLRNNRNISFSAYVKGPKQDGSYFSYGLNFYKNQVKKERWSVGTKLYKVNRLGLKSEIYEVKADDEGRIVDIWN